MSQIGDVLLDQSIFGGVGNIIKNEVLIRVGILPAKKVKDISLAQLKNIIATTRTFVFKFYEWRKNFELKKHYKIYRQNACAFCGKKVLRTRTGLRKRISFICENCEK